MMRPMIRLLALAAALVVSTQAHAAPKKKYHFQLTAVTPKPEVKPDVVKSAQPRVEAQVKKAFETHPQLIATLEGAPALAAAPDPKSMEVYRQFLLKKGISAAYLVTVEITEASEELVPMDGKAKAQRLVVHVGIHMLGETLPGRTMGFTGDGQATIKQEVGMKVRERDRQYAWDSAAEVAVADAMTTVFKQLAVPTKKQ